MGEKKLLNRAFVGNALIIFILSCCGGIMGFTIAVKSGLPSLLDKENPVSELPENLTVLKAGDRFPYVILADSDGVMIELDSLLSLKNTLVAVISPGCEPCLEFVNSAKAGAVLPVNKYQIILLSPDAEYFLDKYNVDAYYIFKETLDEFSINAFPTLIGIDRNKIIRFVSTGYGRAIDSTLLMKYL